MKKTMILITVLLALLNSGCTVGRYSLENKINQYIDIPRIRNSTTLKPITFKIKFDGRIYHKRGMPNSYSQEKEQYWIGRYTAATKQILSKNNFKPVEIPTKNKAKIEPDLLIDITECPMSQSRMVGNEYLTFYSLGLIPSWATRKNQCYFELTDLRTGKSHKYSIDDHRFHHLLMIPFCWILLLVDDSANKYEEALQDFVDYRMWVKQPSASHEATLLTATEQ